MPEKRIGSEGKRGIPGGAAKSKGPGRRIPSEIGGGVLAVFAILVPVLLAAVAVVVHFVGSAKIKADLQDGLDNAVLAGLADAAGPDRQIQRADLFFRTNLASFTDRSIRIDPPSFQAGDGSLSGVLHARIDDDLMKLIGVTRQVDLEVNARAVLDSGPVCILVLEPSDSRALDLAGNARLDAAECVVQVDSAHRHALTQEGHPQLIAKRVRVVGGYTGDGYSQPPMAGTSTVRDPFATTATSTFPAHDDCSGEGAARVINSDRTLQPGTYCGGLNIVAGASVRLMPGVYVMDGGPLSMSARTALTGDEVTIAFTGARATLDASGNSRIRLTSPRIGSYRNIQFLQDTGDTALRRANQTFSVGGGQADERDGSEFDIDGMIYVPDMHVRFFATGRQAINSPSLAIVARRLTVRGDVSLGVTNRNPRQIAVARPPTAAISGPRLDR
jgi:hypothetical protein